MAAFDTPWISMSEADDANDGLAPSESPTYAAFAPSSSTASYPTSRRTVVIQQKSPLLLATPPQVTRALAYSHPFISPLNRLLGLLSWTTDDPWESFLLVAAFWGIALYGDVVLRWTGPILLAIGLVAGMYSRRYTPLSTTYSGSATSAHARNTSSSDAVRLDGSAATVADSKDARHHESLDTIVVSLTTFTHRCNILVLPFIQMTDFLSTQRTATSSTTSPALFALFFRLLILTPIWYALTLPPIHIVTTKRIILTLGTLILTWHSRPATVSRVILWRSRTIRQICSWITGLSLSGSRSTQAPAATLQKTTPLHRSASTKALNSKRKSPGIGTGEGIRFTFALFENQRRWLGIGWTSSMLAYERAPWTDEELNAVPPKDEYTLPKVDGGVATWRWADGSKWKLEVSDDGKQLALPAEVDEALRTKSDGDAPAATAWVYTDTKWRYPRRGQDGWGKYTRRRKWVREAELADADPADVAETTAVELEGSQPPELPPRPAKSSGNVKVEGYQTPSRLAAADRSGTNTPLSISPKKNWFTRKRTASKASELALGDDSEGQKEKDSKPESLNERDSDRDDDGYIPMHLRGRQGTVEADWGVGEDVGLSLG